MQVGIIGFSGYTGVELLRILLQHREISSLSLYTRNSLSNLQEVFPHLHPRLLEKKIHLTTKREDLFSCTSVFFCTPHGVAAKEADYFLEKGIQMVDLSPDHRMKNLSRWEEVYNMPHPHPQNVQKALYALPEVQKHKLAGAQLISVPGCYATSVQLPLFPLLKRQLITQQVSVDAKSGVSGAGRKSNATSNLFSELSSNFYPYATGGHRHQPEILENLQHASQVQLELFFQVHLLPIVRGIESSIYVEPAEGVGFAEVEKCLEEFCLENQFTIYEQQAKNNQIKSVLYTNNCWITAVEQGARILIISCLDNLIKGAAGQAVQAFNLAHGFDETLGLPRLGFWP